MPEYEFYCRSCGKPFTAFMSVKEHDVEVATCPSCHKKKQVEKRIADVNVFTTRKSTGWR
jgi:putative FmdB family regulatory protein